MSGEVCQGIEHSGKRTEEREKKGKRLGDSNHHYANLELKRMGGRERGLKGGGRERGAGEEEDRERRKRGLGRGGKRGGGGRQVGPREPRGPCAQRLKLRPCEEGRWRQRKNTHG